MSQQLGLYEQMNKGIELEDMVKLMVQPYCVAQVKYIYDQPDGLRVIEGVHKYWGMVVVALRNVRKARESEVEREENVYSKKSRPKSQKPVDNLAGLL